MKKILLLIPSAAFTLLLTGCYTNVIDLDDNNGGGGGDTSNRELVISDPTQLNQQIFAESNICEVQFTSKQGWNLNYTDEQTQKWITISPSHSEFGGSFTLSIGVDENQTGGDRTAKLQLISGSANETITINQSSRNKDGSEPLPYEKDAYTDIVEKVELEYVTNGEIGPWSREWRFQTDPANWQVYTIELYSIDSNGEKIDEVIVLLDYMILIHDVFGVLQPDNRWEVVRQQRRELVVNTNNFIIQQQLIEFNFQDENRPESIPLHIIHRYANSRRVAEQVDNNSYKYQWRDGNMIEKLDVTTSNAIQFGYGVQRNNRTNIDLNSLLNGDMYAAMGLFGKRSEKLLESITDYKGGITNFEYSFDQNGRVKTITKSDGSGESSSSVFTVHYVGDNVIDDNSGSK